MSDTTTWGNVYWPVFLVVALAAFLAPEIYALVTTGSPNTLSAWIWDHLNITPGERLGQWSALDFLMFGNWLVVQVWLTAHFFFHRFT